MPTEETRRVMTTYLDAVQSGNVEVLNSLYAEDITWVVPGDLPPSGTHVGLDAVLKVMGQAFHNFVPGSFGIELLSVLADGDHAAVEWTARAKLTKGGDYENHYAFVYEIRDGKIRTMREYADTQYAQRVLFS
jgi:uncharacterized protein (TIGR02246 family)